MEPAVHYMNKQWINMNFLYFHPFVDFPTQTKVEPDCLSACDEIHSKAIMLIIIWKNS